MNTDESQSAAIPVAADPRVDGSEGGQAPGPGSEGRYHALDALRAFALLLGIFFHAAESFCPGRLSWAIVDRHAHELFNFFQHICHSFRLELFFVMAGFFAHLVRERRGLGGFVWNRVQRILVPLVAGWFLIYPVLAYEWLSGASQSGQLGRLGIPPEVAHLPPWQLVLGMFIQGKAFGDSFSLTHLWFLYQLLVVYALVLAAHGIAGWLPGRRGKWRRWIEANFPRTVRGPGSVLFYAALTTPILWTMNGWGVDTPDRSLVPSLPATALYTLCFLVGWLLYRQPDWMRQWPAGSAGYVLGGLALAFGTANYRVLSRWLAFGALPAPWLKLVYSALYALMMWCFIVGIIGLFIRHRGGISRRWRYVADSSYWLYIAHLPVVVALQLWVAKWDAHWAWKYLLIVSVAFPVLFLSYHYLVRSTFIGAQLNGRRYSR